MINANEIQVGTVVVGGEGEDRDTGRVLAIEDGHAVLGWSNGEKTRMSVADVAKSCDLA